VPRREAAGREVGQVTRIPGVCLEMRGNGSHTPKAAYP
jgi:hypothetical protein